MAPAQIPVVLAQKLSTENGQCLVVVLMLAWQAHGGQHAHGAASPVVRVALRHPQPLVHTRQSALYIA